MLLLDVQSKQLPAAPETQNISKIGGADSGFGGLAN